MSRVQYEHTTYTNTETVAAGYLGLGARYHFDAFSTFIEYRHQGAIGTAMVAGPLSNLPADLYGDVLSIGLAYSF